MPSKREELHETDARDVDDVTIGRDWGFRVRSVGQLVAQRHNKLQQRFVERHYGRRIICGSSSSFLIVGVVKEAGHCLRRAIAIRSANNFRGSILCAMGLSYLLVKIAHAIDKDWNTIFRSPTGPGGIDLSCFIVRIYGMIAKKIIHMTCFAPSRKYECESVTKRPQSSADTMEGSLTPRSPGAA